MVRITTESRYTTPHIRYRENVMDGGSTGGEKENEFRNKSLLGLSCGTWTIG